MLRASREVKAKPLPALMSTWPAPAAPSAFHTGRAEGGVRERSPLALDFLHGLVLPQAACPRQAMWSQPAPWNTGEGGTGPRMENRDPGGRGYRVFLPCRLPPLQHASAAGEGGRETAQGDSPPSGTTDWTSHAPLLADFPVVDVKFLQSCLTAYHPRDCSPPGSSVHEILQPRILEWVVMPCSRGCSQLRD